MKLSLTLPSLFPDAVHRAIDTIHAATRSVDYEIVVVSPFEVSAPRVVWVPEHQPRGNCHAHATAYAHATGDVIVALSDDALVRPDWDAHALGFFLERERGGPYALGLHQTNRFLGTVFGLYYAFFPIQRRSTVEAIGGYYSPAYRAHFADPDIAMRIWSAGGRCEFTPRPLIERVHRDEGPLARHKEVSRDPDMATFLERWKPVYGAGWTTDRLEDFNIDIDFAFHLAVSRDHTIRFNNPILCELRDNYFANIAGKNYRMMV